MLRCAQRGMPIYEYRCLACETEFEALVRGAEAAACPACGAATLARLLTACAIGSAARSQRALDAARAAYRRSRDRTDRLRHEAEAIRDHLQQDYGVGTDDAAPGKATK